MLASTYFASLPETAHKGELRARASDERNVARLVRTLGFDFALDLDAEIWAVLVADLSQLPEAAWRRLASETKVASAMVTGGASLRGEWAVPGVKSAASVTRRPKAPKLPEEG